MGADDGGRGGEGEGLVGGGEDLALPCALGGVEGEERGEPAHGCGGRTNARLPLIPPTVTLGLRNQPNTTSKFPPCIQSVIFKLT